MRASCSRRTRGATASGVLANLHLTAGIVGDEASQWLEFPYDPPEWSLDRRDYPLVAPIRAEGGWVTLSELPGLGIELDEEMLARTRERRGDVRLTGAQTAPNPGSTGPAAKSGPTRPPRTRATKVRPVTKRGRWSAASLPVTPFIGWQDRGVSSDAVDRTGQAAVTTETTLDWYGCATFRLRIAGLTIFLDAYIDRAPTLPGTGLTADDIDECDWIVVGHSHFDHLYGAERIMANTGARLIGSYETVRVMEAAGRARRPDDLRRRRRDGRPRPTTSRCRVYPSQHSCVWSHRQMAQPGEVCIGDLGVTWQEQQERMAELQTFLSTALPPEADHPPRCRRHPATARAATAARWSLFDTPDGSLLYQDTSGHWTGILGDLRPDVAILAAAGRGNVDGEPIQGSLAEFVAGEAELLQPRRVLLCHHDNWLPGFSVATDMAPIRAAFAVAALRWN